jgi:hypothetical protein
MEEVLPGLIHWSAFHEGIGQDVHSGFVLASGTLIDPMEPPQGLEVVGALATPKRIVLSNRHHYRHSARYAEHFGCQVLCNEAGLHEFDERRPVAGFAFGDRLARDVRALELGSICAEETALSLELDGGALWFGDGVTRGREGSLAFMPDRLLGDDPEGVRAGLRERLRSLTDEDFDTLLFAHAAPVCEGAKRMLGALVEALG